jgi:hypothetical protein
VIYGFDWKVSLDRKRIFLWKFSTCQSSLASLKDSLNFERALLKLEEPSSQQQKRERTERNGVGNKQPIKQSFLNRRLDKPKKIIIEALNNPKNNYLDLGSPQVESTWQHGLDNWAMSTMQCDKMDLAKW